MAVCQTMMSTAISRDQAEKIYVQHRMMEQAGRVVGVASGWRTLLRVRRCSRMAKDVDAALHAVAETAGGLGKDGAAEFIQKLKTEKRYQRDVY